jgi:hypothetical protein
LTTIGYRDPTNLAASFVITALHALRDAEPELQGTERNLAVLDNTKPADPRDFLHRADAIADPQGQAADIRSDLRLMLRRLDETEVLLRERREFIKKLVG